jgi:hypothetical protein
MKHVLDVMHCDKNLCENVITSYFGRRIWWSFIETWKEWAFDFNFNYNKWQMVHTISLTSAPYVLIEKKRTFLHIIKYLKTPKHYVVAIHNRVAKGGKLRG